MSAPVNDLAIEASKTLLRFAVGLVGHDDMALMCALIGALTTAIAAAPEPEQVLDECITVLRQSLPIIRDMHVKIYAEVARLEAVKLGAVPQTSGKEPS